MDGSETNRIATSATATSAGLPQGLARPGALEDAYLQVSHSLARHNQRAGRVRAAARCWGKRTELLLERGEFGVAEARLSALADLYQASLHVCLQSCVGLVRRADELALGTGAPPNLPLISRQFQIWVS